MGMALLAKAGLGKAEPVRAVLGKAGNALSCACLTVVLFEQRAQLQRRTLLAIGHQRHGGVALVVDLPAQDDRRRFAAVALLTALATLAGRAFVAAPALRCDELPTGAGTLAGIVVSRDEGAAVQPDDVERLVNLARPEGAAHMRARTIATGSCEAEPVGMRRQLAGVLLCLEGPAVMSDDVTPIEHHAGLPALHDRQRALLALLAARALRTLLPAFALRAALALRTDRAGRAVETLLAALASLPTLTARALHAGRAALAGRTGRSRFPALALRTGITGLAAETLRTHRSIGAGGADLATLAGITLLAAFALRARGTIEAALALRTSFARQAALTLQTGLAGCADGAGLTEWTGFALRTGLTLRTDGAGWTGHATLAGFAALPARTLLAAFAFLADGAGRASRAGFAARTCRAWFSVLAIAQ